MHIAYHIKKLNVPKKRLFTMSKNLELIFFNRTSNYKIPIPVLRRLFHPEPGRSRARRQPRPRAQGSGRSSTRATPPRPTGRSHPQGLRKLKQEIKALKTKIGKPPNHSKNYIF